MFFFQLGIGLLCCMLRIFFCICPSTCITSKRRKLKQKGAKVDVDHTTSLLCSDNKRVHISRSIEVCQNFRIYLSFYTWMESLNDFDNVVRTCSSCKTIENTICCMNDISQFAWAYAWKSSDFDNLRQMRKLLTIHEFSRKNEDIVEKLQQIRERYSRFLSQLQFFSHKKCHRFRSKIRLVTPNSKNKNSSKAHASSSQFVSDTLNLH